MTCELPSTLSVLEENKTKQTDQPTKPRKQPKPKHNKKTPQTNNNKITIKQSNKQTKKNPTPTKQLTTLRRSKPVEDYAE